MKEHILPRVAQLFFTLLLLAITLQLLAKTENSITLKSDKISTININKTPQAIQIQATDTCMPVLLWIHGEPETKAKYAAQYFTNNLKEHFVIVNWYPNKSTLKSDKENIKTTLDLTKYLQKRFKKGKIYLAGSSRANIIALQTAQQNAENYWAYIGISPIINTKPSEELIDKSLICSIPSFPDTSNWKAKEITSDIKLTRNKIPLDNLQINDTEDTCKNSNQNNSVSISSNTNLNLPVYFFVGKYDHITTYKNNVIEAYYQKIDAPFKRIIYFNQSAHYPNIEEPKKFQKELIHLTQSYLSDFIIPGNKGRVISPFGPRHWRMHYGTDLKMAKGDTVYAVESGTVIRSNWGTGFGKLIVMQHAHNIQTYYAHLSVFIKKAGDWVEKGEAIGLAGSTGRASGPHLHFEIHENGKAFDSELVFNYEDQSIREEAFQENSILAIHKLLKPQGYAQNRAVPEYYKVRSGDSLWVISRRFKTSMKTICQLNHISENTVLQIGQAIRLF
jgi:murein DD-endopeptidase MepM/ murein hydrolase activator NlpD